MSGARRRPAGNLVVAYSTILIKEVNRFIRIWMQTLLPAAVSMSLYFVIFGNLIGPRIGLMGGFTYMEFIAPGIIMMAIINNAYANVVSSFFGAKFQQHIEEILVAPVPHWVILAGYISGGVVRGLVVGLVVTVVALFFTDLRIHSPVIVILVVTLTAVLFSLAGFINGIYARNFDDISIVPTFVLTPLMYLGGVFYSIELLPEFWQTVSRVNPILYMVNAFRYGILGISDIEIVAAFCLIGVFIVALGACALTLLRRGVGIRE